MEHNPWPSRYLGYCGLLFLWMSLVFFLPIFVFFFIFDVAFVHEQRQQIALALTSSICRFHFSEAINSLCLCIFCIATVPNSTVTAHSNAHKSKWAHSAIMCDICVCCVCGNRHFVYIYSLRSGHSDTFIFFFLSRVPEFDQTIRRLRREASASNSLHPFEHHYCFVYFFFLFINLWG